MLHRHVENNAADLGMGHWTSTPSRQARRLLLPASIDTHRGSRRMKRLFARILHCAFAHVNVICASPHPPCSAHSCDAFNTSLTTFPCEAQKVFASPMA